MSSASEEGGEDTSYVSAFSQKEDRSERKSGLPENSPP